MSGTRRRSRAFRWALVQVGAFASVLWIGLPSRSWGVPPTPESVLGFRPGEDGRLAEWSLVRRYLETLAAHSPRVRVETVGPTTGGRPFLVLTITSEANQRHLEEIRSDNLRLADPRRLAPLEERRLVESGRVVVAMTYGMHSNEVGGTLTALSLAHLLATTQEPALVRALDASVLLLVPCLNPDGHDLVARWAQRQAGTRFEGSEPPELLHRYAGHDNNRDGYAFQLEETRLIVRHIHDRWRPQVHHDAHQMGPDGPRMFLPPYLEPWEPNVDLALRDASAALGSSVARALGEAGLRDIATSALFDAWSPARAYVHTHSGVRILSETAAASLASPRFVGLRFLRRWGGVDPRQPSWNFPLVWPGGRWGLDDIVTYQLRASRTILELVAADRRRWLQRFVDVSRRAATTRRPFAYVVPAPFRDRLALVELQRILLTGGIEIGRARRGFRAGDRMFARGSLVVFMEQPWSPFARTILERQAYPSLSEGASASSPRPYDVTAHTVPLLLGIEVTAVEGPFAASLEPVTEARAPRGHVSGTGGHCAFPHDWAGLVTTSRLLRRGIEVRWGMEATSADGRRAPVGTFFVPSRA